MPELRTQPELDSPIQPDAAAYTAEILRTMRMQFLPKPDVVSQAVWDAALPEPSLQTRRRNVIQKMTGTLTAGDKSVFADLFPAAIDTVLAILEDPQESGKTKLAAAIFVAEQFAGKAQQQIQHTGNILHEFRKHMSEHASEYEAKFVASATSQPEIDKAAQSVNSFLTEKVSENFSVGQRGTIGEEPEQQSE